jgi:signal transduction histidine kinase
MGEVVLYRSERTQVSRLTSADDHGTQIRKQSTGPGATRRIAHEQAVLRHLAGVPGVPRLARRQARQTLILEQEGRPLDSGRMAVPLVWTIGRELAVTLAGVHRAGVVHRDVTPANVVLDAAGSPLLIDYDLALIGVPEADETAGPVGTPGYLAPEQTGRIGPVTDSRADLYGLGATLYTLVVGAPPFEGEDSLELVRDVLLRPPDPPAERCPDVPRRLSDIITRLLEKDPERRYQSAEGLAHDLARGQADPDGGWLLGERDFPASLVPPERLIGRASEIRLLTAALDRALLAGGPAVLVAGPPGIGKSALVRRLRPMITERDGWFAEGRFDQFRTGTDTGGITRALRALIRLVIAEPEPEMEEDRRRLTATLGANAAVACAVIPELADLLGPRPEPPSGDPVTARARISATAVALLRALAARHRIVFVLNDLHWAGTGSLQVLDTIVSAGPIPGLLLVVTYRDGDERSALPALTEGWTRAGWAGPVIQVGGLDRDESAELVAGALRMSPADAAGLTELIIEGSDGNPYATIELLNALRADGRLRLAGDGWVWEPEAVRSFVTCHQLPLLLDVRLKQQRSDTRHRLAALACLGGEVTTGLLAVATGTTEQGLARLLAPAVADGLIDLSGNVVGFRHDLVHKAAMDSLPADEREREQLGMARRLAGHDEYRQIAAEQYLAALSLVKSARERRAAAVLLHAAGRRTIRLTNFPVAAELLGAAERLLAPLLDAAADAARDALDVDRHATLYCLGRLDDADLVYRELTARSPDLLTLAEATVIQINLLAQRGDPRASYALGLDVLRRLGIEPPDDPGRVVAEEFAALRGRMDELAGTTETTDPRVLVTGRLINRLLVPAFQLGTLTHSWVVALAYQLWRREGLCPPVVGAAGAAICATIALHDDYRTGYLLSRYVVEAGREHGYHAETAIARYMHLFLAVHWFEPLEEIVEAGHQAREDLLAAGDVQVAGLLSSRLASVVLETADSLDTVVEEIILGLGITSRTGNRIAEASLLGYRELVRELRGEGGQQAGAAPPGGPALAVHHVNRSIAALLLDEPEALEEHSAAAMAASEAIRGFYVSALARLVRCLSLTARLRDGDTGVEAELAAARDWIARRAADAPRNFGPWLHLVDAERASARGDPDAAIWHFDAGLQEVAGRPWHRAVLAERAAIFHLGQGLIHTGHRLLAEACETYRSWGAAAPAARLEARFPFLRDTATGDSGARSGADRIDLMAILRASRALSSATSLAGLERQVGDVLSAMTGATHVRLALRHRDGEWHLTAIADDTPDGSGSERLMSAVRYVLRTHKPLLVADATRDDRFARDPALAGLDACALLAFPVPSRDVDGAVLILENHRQGGVFSVDRLETVGLIAGQLAVSLDNALLYDSLEDTVRARTADLADRHRELEAANQLKADLIGMLGHEINNPLAVILGNLDLILDEDDLPAAARTALTRVHGTTCRLAAIVQEVLDLVSLDAGRLTAVPVPVRVAGLIETALAGGDVPVTCPPELTAVVQPSHLEQILTNLISNAAKYGGGATEVVAGAYGDEVTIEIRDRGPGVPPEFRDRLFDRFARAGSTAATVTGTGLGLYIVRELARANGGDVDYRPGPAGGSTFRVRLRPGRSEGMCTAPCNLIEAGVVREA